MTPRARQIIAALMALMIIMLPLEDLSAQTCHCDRGHMASSQLSHVSAIDSGRADWHKASATKVKCKHCTNNHCCCDSTSCGCFSVSHAFMRFFTEFNIVFAAPEFSPAFFSDLHTQYKSLPLLRPPIA